MSDEAAVQPGRLIFWPAVITFAVTLLRLVGELQGWSPALFSKQAGGDPLADIFESISRIRKSSDALSMQDLGFQNTMEPDTFGKTLEKCSSTAFDLCDHSLPPGLGA